MATPIPDPPDRKAFLAASATCFIWAGWYLAAYRYPLIERMGALGYWSLPVVAATVGWSLAGISARPPVPFRRRVAGVALGVLASALGFPITLVALVVMIFGMFPILTIFAVAIEILLLGVGFLSIYALCHYAIRRLATS
jgi:hypothetical protein